MDSNSKELPPVVDKAVNAVADAMIVAQGEMLMLPIKKFIDPNNHERVEEIIEKYTEDMCVFASKAVVDYILENSHDLFQNLCRIEALGSIEPFKTKQWTHHQYFLVQDTKGVWYAGSPANYSRNDTDAIQRLTNVFNSPSLLDILSSIQNLEGGLWPTSQSILEELKKHRYEYLTKRTIPVITRDTL